MKKLVMTALVLLTCGAVHALPVGNPSEASLFTNGAWCESSCYDPCDPCSGWLDALSMRVGFAGDYVFNRYMETRISNGGDIDTVSLHTNSGYLALNIYDRLDVFTRLGASQLNIESGSILFAGVGTDQGQLELQFTTEFSWSIGARATVWECNCLTVGVEGEYFETKPKAILVSEEGSGSGVIEGLDAKYKEWQVGLGASYRFATSCPTLSFVPYVAVKVSDSRLDLGTFMTQGQSETARDLEADKLWGCAVGLSLTLCDEIGVTVEGRFFDENALYVNGQFRF